MTSLNRTLYGVPTCALGSVAVVAIRGADGGPGMNSSPSAG
jgi:hypothetical protein